MSHPSTIGDYEKMCYLLMEEHGIEKRGEEMKFRFKEDLDYDDMILELTTSLDEGDEEVKEFIWKHYGYFLRYIM